MDDPGTLPRSANKTTTPSIVSVEELRSAAIRDDWRRLLINSLVLAVTIPALLWRSGGDPVLAGWSLSLFMVFYLFCCACFFSTAATPLAKIFVSLSCVGLLSFLAGCLVSNVLGVAIMYLDSVLAAGLFGDTLAQYRESNGTERATLVAVANAPVRETRSKSDAYFFLGVLALCYALGLVWMMLNPDCDVIDVAQLLLEGLHCLSFLQMFLVVGWLNGAILGDDDDLPIIFWWFLVIMIFLCSSVLVGELVAVTVLWLCVHASTAFNGYCLRLHASYEYIMSRIRPPLCVVAGEGF